MCVGYVTFVEAFFSKGAFFSLYEGFWSVNGASGSAIRTAYLIQTANSSAVTGCRSYYVIHFVQPSIRSLCYSAAASSIMATSSNQTAPAVLRSRR